MTYKLESCHEHSRNNIAELQLSSAAGCFYCLHTYEPGSIKDWCDDGTTALCPQCGVDAVLGDRCVKEVRDAGFLAAMSSRWFGKHATLAASKADLSADGVEGSLLMMPAGDFVFRVRDAQGYCDYDLAAEAIRVRVLPNSRLVLLPPGEGQDRGRLTWRPDLGKDAT